MNQAPDLWFRASLILIFQSLQFCVEYVHLSIVHDSCLQMAFLLIYAEYSRNYTSYVILFIVVAINELW